VLRSEGSFGGWLLAVWEGRVCLDAWMGKKKEKQGRGGEGRQRGDILTFTDGITDIIFSSVIPSAILSMKGTRHCTEIPV